MQKYKFNDQLSELSDGLLLLFVNSFILFQLISIIYLIVLFNKNYHVRMSQGESKKHTSSAGIPSLYSYCLLVFVCLFVWCFTAHHHY